ncbi:hypothetical protein C8R43DRAFT_975740 [Mycena crocata]|nr:hypothetical protein C8R43DRAFT_975740 [Mycena crocata]
MSTSRPPNTTVTHNSSPSQAITESSANSDWLANSLLTAKIITAVGECAPFPGVKGAFGAVVALLEAVQKVRNNRDSLKELCENAVEIITIVRDQVVFHGDSASRFQGQCGELESLLQDVIVAVKKLKTKPQGFRAHLKEFVKSTSNGDVIAGYQQRIRNLRDNFGFMATIDTNFQVGKVLTVLSPNLILPPTQKINTCPPASRIFQGRATILNQMHTYFSTDPGNQHISLLHGLGGTGKTQVALKFIEESASKFSDIFMVDTSTIETIDAGLKNIVICKNSGTTARDALAWLVSKPDEWLLFFDNADNPNLDLNKFLPRCKHGNVIITSRNPGLCVYAGSQYLVSDMEETDAINLLLKSASVESTEKHKEIAGQIVKTLYYLPLAIIQAGAFISKSGNLGSYLELYSTHKMHLLSEKPTQSQDDYAWTVYTTWQISFDQLSKPATMLLQLCSFLHFQGLSEEIFRSAAGYMFPTHGPSRKELHQPLLFLSHFLGQNDVWDSLQFMEVINEIRAYSLIEVDAANNQFSFHPLVHAWAQNTVSDQKLYYSCICAIIGMCISQIPQENIRLASLIYILHIDSLQQLEHLANMDFPEEYARVYYYAQRNMDALRIADAVLKKRKKILGDDHPDTLKAMGNLAATYHKRGQLKHAEDLKRVVLEKRMALLGDDHPETLQIMSSLALTYFMQGELKVAQALHMKILNSRKKVLGEDHPDTLHTMDNLASDHYALKEFDLAASIEIVVVEKQRKILGEYHPDTLNTLSNLASTYNRLDEINDAAELHRVVLERRRSILGDDHPDTIQSMQNLAAVYQKIEKLQSQRKLQDVGEMEEEVVEGNSVQGSQGKGEVKSLLDGDREETVERGTSDGTAIPTHILGYQGEFIHKKTSSYGELMHRKGENMHRRTPKMHGEIVNRRTQSLHGEIMHRRTPSIHGEISHSRTPSIHRSIMGGTELSIHGGGDSSVHGGAKNWKMTNMQLTYQWAR